MGPSKALLLSFFYCLDEDESFVGGRNEHLPTSCHREGDVDKHLFPEAWEGPGRNSQQEIIHNSQMGQGFVPPGVVGWGMLCKGAALLLLTWKSSTTVSLRLCTPLISDYYTLFWGKETLSFNSRSCVCFDYRVQSFSLEKEDL